MRRWIYIMALLAMGGCASDQPSMTERQEKAIANPWGYSPGLDRTDISGGGITDFKKDAFKKDVDDVFSP